jgi:hypothetical protein
MCDQRWAIKVIHGAASHNDHKVDEVLNDGYEPFAVDGSTLWLRRLDDRVDEEHATELDRIAAECERLERERDIANAQAARLAKDLEEAQLRSIEARNPGIDIDEVRRIRAGARDAGWHPGDVVADV